MRTGNEARAVQAVSLKDEIKRLQAELTSARKEIADWKADKKTREDALAALDKQLFAAKEAHKGLLKAQNAELEQKQVECARLSEFSKNLEEWHSHQAAEKSVEMMALEETINGMKEEAENRMKANIGLRQENTRLSTDKVLALKDTAKALEENRKAVETLEQTKAKIAQAEKDWQTGEAARLQQTNFLRSWEDRLVTKDTDLKVIAERLEPKFHKVFPKSKINAHLFKQTT